MVSMKVIVIGGGVMGCMSALRLAQGGADVLVLERSVPGAEASSAAAGILAPSFEAAHVPLPEQILPLGVASRDLHEKLADELQQEHGIDVGFRRCGVLAAAFSAQERAHLESFHEKLKNYGIAGSTSESIDGAEARRREPALSDEALGGLDFKLAAQLEPKRFLPALAIAAERAGAVFRSGAFVRGVEHGEGSPRVLVGDDTLHADHVVVAAGSWTGLVPGLGIESARVHPVRGQIVETRSRPPLFRRVVFGAGGYIVTRPSGEVLCGSTEERVGFRKEVSFEGMSAILAMAVRVAPRLRNAPILNQWASFRPATGDELPLVGAAGPKGVWLSTGHFRNGILQAPISADILTRAILGKEPSRFASLVDPGRFR
ncbi:MAG: glycine oxidase [Polyangiales bacterium]|jgi:glycine oxidase